MNEKKILISIKKKTGRFAACYLIDNQAANNILKYIKEAKVNLPIDWFHNLCVENNIINIYWSQPTIAIQGSLDGSIKSLIDDKKFGFFRVLSFKIQRIYKKILYQMR